MLSARILAAIIPLMALAVSLVFSAPAAEAQTAQLTPPEIYERIADAVPLVETPLGRGSGILIDQRRVVTDAHVVSPFETVTVRFRDGRTDEAVRVIGLDQMADLAVLELSSSVPYTAAAFGPGTGLAIGEELYLVGYPASFEEGAQPTISRGLLSRFRTWEAIGMTYLETDASAAPGLSGGAVVSSAGAVVGVTQFAVSSGFTLAASGDDVDARVRGLIAGEQVDGLGDRDATGPAGSSHTFSLDDVADEAVFVVPASATGAITVTVNSAHDAAIGLVRADGFFVEVADSTITGTERLTATVAEPIRYYILVRQFEPDPGTFTLQASRPVTPLTDPDDRRGLADGDTYFGALDYPEDRDSFVIDLEAGQTLSASVESVTFDTVAVIYHSDDPFDDLAFDDDGGGGLFGTDTLVEFTAIVTGEYRLVVFPYFDEHGSGYVVSTTITDPAPTVGPAFSARLPAQGVGLTAYGGGHISQLISSAAIDGCDVTSFWVTEFGRLIGYIVGAPSFVNDQILWMLPGGQIPAGTPMLVSCN